MTWYYSQPSSSPWKPTNSLQAAENYLRQMRGQSAYGYSQVPPQYYQQSRWPNFHDRSFAEPYQQPAEPQYYQQTVPQYYQQAVQPYYQQPAEQQYYYQPPVQESY